MDLGPIENGARDYYGFWDGNDLPNEICPIGGKLEYSIPRSLWETYDPRKGQ